MPLLLPGGINCSHVSIARYHTLIPSRWAVFCLGMHSVRSPRARNAVFSIVVFMIVAQKHINYSTSLPLARLASFVLEDSVTCVTCHLAVGSPPPSLHHQQKVWTGADVKLSLSHLLSYKPSIACHSKCVHVYRTTSFDQLTLQAAKSRRAALRFNDDRAYSL